MKLKKQKKTLSGESHDMSAEQVHKYVLFFRCRAVVVVDLAHCNVAEAIKRSVNCFVYAVAIR